MRLPTRITHNTSILTDNIYIKCKRYDERLSNRMSVDIADLFQLFTLVIQINNTNSLPRKATDRHVDDMKLISI